MIVPRNPTKEFHVNAYVSRSILETSHYLERHQTNNYPLQNRLHQDIRGPPSKSSNRMVPIVTKDQAISKSIADTAASSLEEQIALLKEEGALKAGALKNGKPYSFVILKWTPEIMAAARAFKAVSAESNIRSLETKLISVQILRKSGILVLSHWATSGFIAQWYILTLRINHCRIPALCLRKELKSLESLHLALLFCLRSRIVDGLQ